MTPSATLGRNAARQAGEPLISLGGDDAAPYSLLRAIGLAASGSGAGFEAEVSAELARATSLETHAAGVLLPPQIFASLDGATSAGGAELVFTAPGGFSPARRPAPVVARLGARVLPVSDKIRLVRVAGGHSVEWQTAEIPDALIDQEDIEFATEAPGVSLGMVSTAWSRRLEAQSDPYVGAIVTDDFHAAVSAAIDAALIGGTGADGQPEGLTARDDIAAIDLLGAAPDYDDLIEAEALLADVNVPGEAAWLTGSRGRQALRSVAVLGNAAAGPVWRDGRVLGAPAAVSNHAAGVIIHGVWRNAVVGLHAVEVVVDAVTTARRGLIVATVFVHVSIGLQEPAAFILLTNGLYPAPES